MWELSYRHCCATCRFSQKSACTEEAAPSPGRLPAFAPALGAEGLFPLLENLLCQLCRESLAEPSVQAVLVRPDGRCPAYECLEERYLAMHGALPEEDEASYALAPAPDGGCAALRPNL